VGLSSELAEVIDAGFGAHSDREDRFDAVAGRSAYSPLLSVPCLTLRRTPTLR